MADPKKANLQSRRRKTGAARTQRSALSTQHSALLLRTQHSLLLLGFILAVALSVLAARTQVLPGDIGVTRTLQALFGADMTWALWITETAKPPWMYALAAAVAVISWLVAGWRAAVLAVVCAAGAVLGGPALQNWIARPRPTPEYVRVVVASPGFSFPSIFALVYGSTIGYLLILVAGSARGRERTLWVAGCMVLLCAGGAARVVLGAHWPSDVLISYLMVLVWAGLLVRFA
ncbi:MAG: phosphatase PAP2 family protein [Acidobacteria bacterium]|nr:phosphatase PAP2 family protein [Acidobacteriota bacterium]MCW5968574.1 phosphatase PAP2 family protein [Blastocatellales bacterium]